LGEGEGAYITEITPGISIDMGVKDAANMGAAMAPAVLSTLTAYFDETGHSPTDFDGIFTGDLGYEGSAILIEQMKNKGYDISGIHKDCGLIIYDIKNQDVHAGGSGCGCSASVLSAYILPKLERGEINNILFIATGALMSPLAIQQGQSIPGIAHLVRICKEKCL
jgi:stage V sporulation protein AD